jgi:hypothetical protein
MKCPLNCKELFTYEQCVAANGNVYMFVLIAA